MQRLYLQVCFWGLMLSAGCLSSNDNTETAVTVSDQSGTQSEEISLPETDQLDELLKITPVEFDGDMKRIELSSPISDLVVGARGRYLFLKLKNTKELAVFDTSEAKIIKKLPMLTEDFHFAAGARELVVFYPRTKMIQRWDLLTLEPDAIIASSITEPVFKMEMGHSSEGPLILMTGNLNEEKKCQFLDPKTLNLLEKSPVLLLGNSRTVSWGAGNDIRVSGNGQVAIVNFSILMLDGDTFNQYGFYLYNKGLDFYSREMLLNHDGSIAFANGRLFANDDEINEEVRESFSSRRRRAIENLRQGKPSQLNEIPIRIFPAVGPGYYFDAFGKIYLEDEKKLLGSVVSIDLEQSRILLARSNSELEIYKHYTLVPNANTLIQIPGSCDELIVHKVNIDELLEKNGDDYFFLTSDPSTTAALGKLWQYQLKVKSKKGGVKYKLGSGSPRGMTVSSTGLVSWDVPEKYPLSKVNLDLYLEDDSGKKIEHPFTLLILAK